MHLLHRSIIVMLMNRLWLSSKLIVIRGSYITSILSMQTSIISKERKKTQANTFINNNPWEICKHS